MKKKPRIAVRALISNDRQEVLLLKRAHTSYSEGLWNLPNELSDKHYVTMVFVCKTKGAVRLSDESSEYRWLAREEPDSVEIAFLNAQVIRKFWNVK